MYLQDEHQKQTYLVFPSGNVPQIREKRWLAPLRIRVMLCKSFLQSSRYLVFNLIFMFFSHTEPGELCQSFPRTQARPPLLHRNFTVSLLSRGVPLRTARGQQQWRRFPSSEVRQPAALMAGPDWNPSDQLRPPLPADPAPRGCCVLRARGGSFSRISPSIHSACPTHTDAGTLRSLPNAWRGKAPRTC